MEIGVRFIGAVLIFLEWLLTPLYWWRARRKTHPLPPVNEPLLQHSATYLAENIRKRIITSEEVVRAYIERIKEVNPILNAVVEERFNAALAEARNVDKYIGKNVLTTEELKEQKPLLGVPLTVKESCGLAGLSHCVGSLTRVGIKAHSDGKAVAKLKDAGAIPLLVSNTPELCLDWESNNFVTGATRNPYNTNYTSGGSSGGEGALIGAAASVIGVASDIAGSIRLPAMFNGVFGHKPTAGLVPIEGHFPYCMDKNFGEYLVIGPIVRYAEDLKLLMNVLVSDAPETLRLEENVDLSRLTVYYMDEAGYSLVLLSVEKEIKTIIGDAIKHLKEVCCSNVDEFKFKEMEDSCEISIALFFAMKDIPNVLEFSTELKESHNLYIELIKSAIGSSMFFKDTLMFYLLQRTNVFIPRRKYGKYEAYCKHLKEKFMDKLGSSGVFLYPTFPTSAFVHGAIATKISGVVYTMIFNVLGFPSTHVPLGFDKRGLPIGLQVVAAPNQDRLCIAVAMELERRFGGWKEPRS